MKNLLSLYKKYREIIQYLIFGVGTTVVSWGTYSICAKIFGIPVAGSNIISWFLAIVFAYVTNKLWVFESKSWKVDVFFSELYKFVSARFLTGLIEILGVPFMVSVGMDQEILGVPGMLAKIIASVIVVILNYFISKFLIFVHK